MSKIIGFMGGWNVTEQIQSQQNQHDIFFGWLLGLSIFILLLFILMGLQVYLSKRKINELNERIALLEHFTRK